MIVDRLSRADRYRTVHAGLAAGFEFLRREDLAQLADGRHTIDGDRLFAIAARETGRGREKALVECHRRYIDIQYVVSGRDCIGWLPTEDCSRVSTPYDAEKDLAFFYDRPSTWLDLPAGSFACFFPEDAHAPLAATGQVHKVVVKVALD